jgi:hypothetical protein
MHGMVSMGSLPSQNNRRAVLITFRHVDVARVITGRDKDIIKGGTMDKNEATQIQH